MDHFSNHLIGSGEYLPILTRDDLLCLVLLEILMLR